MSQSSSSNSVGSIQIDEARQRTITNTAESSANSSLRGACAVCDCNMFDGMPYASACVNCGHYAESHLSLFGAVTANDPLEKASEKELANNFLMRLRRDTRTQAKLFDLALDAFEQLPNVSIAEAFRHALKELDDLTLPDRAIAEIVQHLDDRLHRPENGGISDDELAITFATQPYAKSGWCTFLTQCQWETNICNTTTCFACS